MTLLLFLSCSRQQKTTLIISRGASVEVSQNGGIMIWGYHFDTGQTMAISLQGEYAKEIELEMGEWEFFAVGWSGTNSMEGANRCAFESVTLFGARETLSLTLNKSTCSNGDFSDSAYIDSDNQFKKFQLIDCASESDLSGVSSAEDSSCDQVSSQAGSFRLIFYEVLESDITGNGPESECQTFSGSTATTNLLIPTGNSSYNSFYTSVEVYSDSECTEDLQLFSYLNGIIESETYNPDQSKFFANSTNETSFTNLYISYTAKVAAAEAEDENEVVAEVGDDDDDDDDDDDEIIIVEQNNLYTNDYSLLFYTVPINENQSAVENSPLAIGSTGNSPGVDGTDDMTISFWTKVRSSVYELGLEVGLLEQSDDDISTDFDSPIRQFDIRINFVTEDPYTYRLCFDFENSAQSVCEMIDENNFFDDQWHHLVFIRKSNEGDTEMYLYIDNQVSQQIYTASQPDNATLEAIIIAPEFHGGIDELAIWNTALSNDQVEAIYNNAIPFDLTVDSANFAGDYASSGSLTGFWNFNQGDGIFNLVGESIEFGDLNGNNNYNAISEPLLNFMTTSYPPHQRNDVPASPEYMNMKSMYFESDPLVANSNWHLIRAGTTANSLATGNGTPFTISAWIKTNSQESCQTIIAQADYVPEATADTNRYILAVRNGKVTWEVFGGADGHAFQISDINNFPGEGILISADEVDDGEWHHVVVVRSATELAGNYWDYIYIDSQLNYLLPESESEVTLNSVLHVSIGGDTAGYVVSNGVYNDSCLFQGYIDEVSIWNVALSDNEVTALWNSGYPIDITEDSGNYTSSNNLFSYWSFDEQEEPYRENITYYEDIDPIDGVADMNLTSNPVESDPLAFPVVPPYDSEIAAP